MGPARALVVVDQPLANLIALTLGHGTYETRIAPTAKIGQTDLEKWRPHLLLVDLDAEDTESLGLIGRRVVNRRVPTIAFSERGDLKTKLAAFERGVDDIVTVPFVPEELVARSLALMRRSYRDDVAFIPVIKVAGVEVQGESPRALIVMNETLGRLLSLTLQHGRYETQRVTNANECRALLEDWAPHLMFIDLDLYGQFIDIVGRGLTHGHIPILAFTRRRDTALKLRALERGADDIVEVPFTLDEIVARPFALLRRCHGMTVTIVSTIRLDGIEVDLIEQRVRVRGRELHLTPIQQTLLYLLAANAGKALSREDLLATIWGGAVEIESNVVDRHIRELRVKLGDDWRVPRFIETVPGAGYRFKSQAAVGAQPSEAAAQSARR